MNERLIEKRVQFAVNSMVEQTVTDIGLMDISWFGVADIKSKIGTVAISLASEIRM
ncbi:hypothetical protein JXA05_01540 [Candidatus Peregrinibacteria bacterium]|nr:hypothetical protein [Candidatus Peregrinibacteria bacterium]